MRAATMLQRCGALAPPTGSCRATSSTAAFCQTGGKNHDTQFSRHIGISNTSTVRRRRHGQRTTLNVSAVVTPPRETVASAPARGVSSLAGDVLPFDHLGRNNFDAVGVIERHSQRQRFPPCAHFAAAAAAVGSPLDDEFPPAPPPMITYEEVAPFVELVRLSHPPSAKENDPRQRQSRPLALPVLVGWFGARASHLRKYAAMYLVIP
jgi:hypothetical protein